MKEMNKICNNADKKIIFFDIDDTLFSAKLGVPASAVEAIQKLRANGHLAFICTGRTKAMIVPSMIDIGFDGIIAGAGTYCEYGGEVLYREDMSEEEAKYIVQNVRNLGFVPVPEGHDNMYYDKELNWSAWHKSLFGELTDHFKEILMKIPDDDENICVSKVSAAFTKESRHEEAVELFQDNYVVVNHGNVLLELIPKGKSKAKGIEYILNKLSLDRENTYAFGDSMNDYEMVKYVKYGVAMGNADENLKKAADYVTDTVENDGIYKALEHFGLI